MFGYVCGYMYSVFSFFIAYVVLNEYCISRYGDGRWFGGIWALMVLFVFLGLCIKFLVYVVDFFLGWVWRGRADGEKGRCIEYSRERDRYDRRV